MQPEHKPRPMSLLFALFRGSRGWYAFAFVFMVLTMFMYFLLPQLVSFVVDSVIGGLPVSDAIPFFPALIGLLGGTESMRRDLVLVGVLVLAAVALRSVFNCLYRWMLAKGAEGLIKRLRDWLYTHIQHLPYRWHVSIMTGDIIQRCTSDVDVVRNFVTNQLLEMARCIVMVTIAYSLLAPMNLTMTLASAAYLPIMFFYSFFFIRKASDRFLKADEAEGYLLSIAQENFQGVRVVRAFGRERYEVDRFDKQNRHFADLWLRLGNLLSYYWGAGDLITGMQMITICVLGVFEAIQGRITVGGFMVFLTYNSMTIWPVRGLGRVLSEASKTFVSLGRLQEILGAQPETDAADALEAPLDGDIVFDHVSFSYDGQQVLDDVSFTVEKGTTLGILGSTGSGKTTVAHLLCRLYDLEEGKGRITVGGVDITRFKRGWLRKNIGIVLQEPFLYSRTIQDNVASLSKHYTLDQIRAATRISSVDDDIQGFAKGYGTLVGERGVTLSGGQKQRVAIARTILQDPPVMIFDDSLSAVDTETDVKIRQGLAARTKGVTTLIISHRITSLSSANQVIVMDGGRIVERGTPAELLRQDGVYRRIHDMQESVEEELQDMDPTPSRKEVE